MTAAEMQKKLEALEAENAALKAKGKKPFSLKVSDKGALSIYGLQRFPVTLYKEQWIDILETHRDEILKFMAENDTKLKNKE